MSRQSGLWRACLGLVRRDLLCVSRHRAEVANPLLFFAMVATIFPIALGPDPEALAAIGPGAIWASALLSTLVSLEGMFRPDLEDGSIEQLLLCPHPLPVLVLAKVCAHWLATGLPLLLLAPLLALQFGLTMESTATLLLSLVLGTPALSLLGAVGVGRHKGLTPDRDRPAAALATLSALDINKKKPRRQGGAKVWGKRFAVVGGADYQ